MLQLCLLFSALIVLIQPGDLAVQARSPFILGLPPSLYQHDRKAKRTTHTENVDIEVAWQTNCSPRLAWVRMGQDARLQCDVIVPSGTQLVWFKSQQRLERPGAPLEETNNNLILEAMEEETNMVGFEEASIVSSSSARVKISSTVYIDCANDHDAGQYSLEVKTPSNNVYFRNFTISLTEMGQQGRSCPIRDIVPYLPRIYQYSTIARAVVGSSLVLPCRAQGLYTDQSWHVNSTEITNIHSNYQVLANGDLVIRQVNQHEPVTYMCRVSSTQNSDYSPDAIFTTVSIQVQDQ